MSSAYVGYYYCSHTGRLRWIMVPESEAELRPSNYPTEHLLAVPRDVHVHAAQSGPVGHQAIVNTHTGLAPDKEDRHVKIHRDTGEILGVMYHHPCCGDPERDPAGHYYRQHPEADHHWRLVAGELRSPKLEYS